MNGKVRRFSPLTTSVLVVVWLCVFASLSCQTRTLNEQGDGWQSQLSVLWNWEGATQTSGSESCETTAGRSFPGFQAPFRVMKDPLEGHYFINECGPGNLCLDSTQTGPQFLERVSEDRLVSTSALSWNETSGSPGTCVYERSVLTLTVKDGVLTLNADVEVFRVAGFCLPDAFRQQSVSADCSKSLRRSARPVP